MRKLLVPAVLAGLLFSGVSALDANAELNPAGTEGCIANPQGTAPQPAGLFYKDTCTYTATRDGGYVADGDWTVTIVRDTHTVDPVTGEEIYQTITLEDGAYADQCTTSTKAGDVVTATINDANSFVAAGNPTPAGTPSTNTAGDDYTACAA